MHVFLAVLAASGTLYWLATVLLSIRAMRSMRVLQDLDAPPPAGSWPRVSIIIPACNEAASLEEAMHAKLAEDYPELELVLVDDRSTDGTRAIVERIAGGDPRVRPLFIRELPPGWLGKVHALERGYRASTGEWVLFSDADVHIAPGTLKKAIAWCEQRGIDHLSVLPELWSSTFLLDAVFSAFVRIMCVAGRVWAVEDPRSSAVVGSGCFNLVRRAALERTPGLAGIKLDVVDDAALGDMLKRSGARTAVVNARGCVGLYFYRSLAEMARGVEKNAFAVVGGYSFPRLLAAAALMLGLELSPLIAITLADAPAVRVLGAALFTSALVISAVVSRWAARPVLPALFQPVAIVLFVCFALRSGVLAVLRGGITWRGTLYAIAELREGTTYHPRFI